MQVTITLPGRKKVLTVLALGAALAASIGGNALADPASSPPIGPNTLVGVGSDTTQGVLNGLAGDVNAGQSTQLIASYDAVGSATITPPGNGCSAINRPNGSGAGVAALIASQNAKDGCIDFARSSANDSASRAGANLTYIPFAKDAVTYAVRGDSSLSKTYTVANLTAIYNCNVSSIQPLLPKFGSGTRKFFLQSLGFTDSSTFAGSTGHACVKDTDAAGNPLEENTGNLLYAANQVIPYSVAVYQSQLSQTVADVRGTAQLGSISGISPTLLNSNPNLLVRDVYNVLPNSLVSNPTAAGIFVGSGSQICTDTSTITKYGFGINPNCGSTAITTP